MANFFYKTQTYSLSLEQGNQPQAVVHIHQHDNLSRGLVFEILDLGEIPTEGEKYNNYYTFSETDCWLKGKKPNGLGFSVLGTLEKNGDHYRASFRLNDSVTECFGCIEAFLKIQTGLRIEGGTSVGASKIPKFIVGTANIILEIQKDPSATTNGSKAEVIDDITTLINNAEKTMNEQVSTAKSHADDAKTYANASKTSAEDSASWSDRSGSFAEKAEASATNASNSEKEINKKVTDLEYTQSKIQTAISKIKTEKLSEFLKLDDGVMGKIDWDNSNVYRSGAHVFGQLAFNNSGYVNGFKFQNVELLPECDKVFGTILFLNASLPDGHFTECSHYSLTKSDQIEDYFVLNVDDGSAKTFDYSVIILDYFCKAEAIYFDGDQEYF